MTKRSIQLGLLVLLKQVFCCTKFLESFLNRNSKKKLPEQNFHGLLFRPNRSFICCGISINFAVVAYLLIVAVCDNIVAVVTYALILGTFNVKKNYTQIYFSVNKY